MLGVRSGVCHVDMDACRQCLLLAVPVAILFFSLGLLVCR